MKKLLIATGCLCLLLASFGSQLMACDRSSLTLNSVTPSGGGNYDISLTFCTGAGVTGIYLGAEQNTGVWALEVFGAAVTGFPASLTSPANGNVYNGSVDPNTQWLRFNPAVPGSWWTCMTSHATCGDTATICVTFTITTAGLPGEIRLLGAEGANVAFSGCTGMPEMTVFPNPVCSTSTIAGNVNVVSTGCNSRTLDLTVTGGSPSYSYLWYSSPFPATQDISITNSGTYNGSAWDMSGCATSFAATATISPAVANAGADRQLYIGYGATCTTLTGTGSGGTAPYTYRWSNGSNTASINVCPTVTTSYTVTVTDAVGCSSTDAVVVNVTDVRCSANKVSVCHGGTTKCVPLPQVASHLAHGDVLGSCSGKFAGDEPAAALTTSFEVYPNPASQRAYFSVTLADAGQAAIDIFDLQGKLVSSVHSTWMTEGEEQTLEADISGFTPGLYIIRMATADGQTETRKLVVNN